MEPLRKNWYNLLLVIGLIIGLGLVSRGMNIGFEGGFYTGSPSLKATQATLELQQTEFALQQTSFAQTSSGQGMQGSEEMYRPTVPPPSDMNTEYLPTAVPPDNMPTSTPFPATVVPPSSYDPNGPTPTPAAIP